jgi:hypothetical protein
MEAIERADVVTGIWKFDRTVDPTTLVSYALELKKNNPGLFRHLYVRGCSKGQFGIGFQFELVFEDHKKFHHRMTDQLRRKFGNDFVGWDLSSPTWIISV